MYMRYIGMGIGHKAGTAAHPLSLELCDYESNHESDGLDTSDGGEDSRAHLGPEEKDYNEDEDGEVDIDSDGADDDGDLAEQAIRYGDAVKAIHRRGSDQSKNPSCCAMSCYHSSPSCCRVVRG